MTNYEHYQATVERVNATILRDITVPWKVKYQPFGNLATLESNEQLLFMVAPSGTVSQRLLLPPSLAQKIWPDNEPVNRLVTEYVVRGAARLAPLRQPSYRNNFPHWLEQSLQQLHYLVSSKEQLLQVMEDSHYPFPSKVKIEGSYLPCWVWYQKDGQSAVSVIDRRTGLFSKPRSVDHNQLVDNEKWLGAQVIDSVDESIETITYYVSELIKGQKQPDKDEPTLTDAIHNPCSSTLSPVFSVALTMGVVAGFFIILKMFLGF
ncbi:hypothetical protein MD588_08035 [Photobacterium sp. SDRW27]|uniref:hypothetical protein n=1 Tax=Photobacterium obscurum TaxID=2829490 RepID=UPI0022441E0B|nr:hypothetical protein [Photobacterium obscurum]MCW8328756.1 hypothetical protein [Photobacterium obscurum]